MVSKFPQCTHNGHTSTTCNDSDSNSNGAKVVLFGVDLIPQQNTTTTINSSSSSSEISVNIIDDSNFISRPKTQDSRGIPWTQEEHLGFLAGLKHLGRGEWRRISMEFVKTRTSTQVASHAQKYFIKIQSLNQKKKKKKRSSIFDTTLYNHNNEIARHNLQTDCTRIASNV